jgi:hypothetical protein
VPEVSGCKVALPINFNLVVLEDGIIDENL